MTAACSCYLRSAVIAFVSAPEKRIAMKKFLTSKAEGMPTLKHKQLGKGACGKYFRQYSQASNAVVLQPEILKAFRASEAVDQAPGSLLAFTGEAVRLTSRSGRRVRGSR